jgi:hypothetical protein
MGHYVDRSTAAAHGSELIGDAQAADVLAQTAMHARNRARVQAG